MNLLRSIQDTIKILIMILDNIFKNRYFSNQMNSKVIIFILVSINNMENNTNHNNLYQNPLILVIPTIIIIHILMKFHSNNNPLIITLLICLFTSNSLRINLKTHRISMARQQLLIHFLTKHPNLLLLLKNMKKHFMINFISELWMCLDQWTKGRSNCFSHLQWENLINLDSLSQCITLVWIKISWYSLGVRWIPCRMCSWGMDG